MKTQILTSAIGALAFTLGACNNTDTGDDADTADTAVETEAAPATTTASADWPAGTRIVEENNVTYRVNPDNTRVEIPAGGYRIVTVDGERYRVDASGTPFMMTRFTAGT